MSDNQQPSVQRTCKKCGETKAFEDFAIVYAKNSRGQNYRQHTCMTCHRVIHAERQRRAREMRPDLYHAIQKRSWFKNHEANKASKRAWNRKLKDEAFGSYGGYRCVCCGETQPCMLNLDHVNNDGAEHRKQVLGHRRQTTWQRGNGGANFYQWLRDNGYPPGVQVLCYNCNISKHRNKGVCAHRLNEGSTTIPQGSRAKRPEAHCAP